MSAFRWTARRDALLAECRTARFTWAETERAIGCKPGVARVRWQQLRDQEYQGACGTAREASTTAESTVVRPEAAAAASGERDTVSAPLTAGDATGSPDVSPAPTPPLAEGNGDRRRSGERRVKASRAIVAVPRRLDDIGSVQDGLDKCPRTGTDEPRFVGSTRTPAATVCVTAGETAPLKPRPALISLNDVPSSMEQRAASWRTKT